MLLLLHRSVYSDTAKKQKCIDWTDNMQIVSGFPQLITQILDFSRAAPWMPPAKAASKSDC